MSVLLSGLASLILTSKEEKLLNQHYKVHLQRLLKLHQATPAPVVFFLAGCLPLPSDPEAAFVQRVLRFALDETPCHTAAV